MRSLLAISMICVACTGEPVDTAPADTAARAPLQLAFPLSEPERFDGVLGLDHDPAVYDGIEQLICLDYAERPWPHCYDEHDGTDYLLSGSWDAMDSGSSPIVAAADGVVVATDDGNYDRCHGDASTFEVSCDGYEKAANYVILEHDGGWRTLYWHMLSGSVAVEVGQTVACGEELGLVGSSGNSSQPHLHFELQDGEGVSIDPYAGALSQEETWWISQGDLDGLPGVDCGG